MKLRCLFNAKNLVTVNEILTDVDIASTKSRQCISQILHWIPVIHLTHDDVSILMNPANFHLDGYETFVDMLCVDEKKSARLERKAENFVEFATDVCTDKRGRPNDTSAVS